MAEIVERSEITDGLVVFEDVVAADLIRNFNDYINAQRRTPGYQEFRDDQFRSLILNLQADRRYSYVERLCKRATALTLKKQFGRSAPAGTTYFVRCADPSSGMYSHKRHFDSHLMTLLIPLQKADFAEEDGDLILYGRAGFPISAAGNILRKIVGKIDQKRPLPYRRIQTAKDLGQQLCQRICCKLGNVYFFNGYALKHCNLDVSSGERRALIVHAYDAGNSWGMNKLTARWQWLR